MATATREVEQIVRKVITQELDETVNAIQELSTLVTEEVIPRLSRGSDDMPDSEEDEEPTEDEDSEATGVRSLSGFNGSGAKRRRKPVNGHDDDDVEMPEQHDVPESVVTAFAELYSTLSPDQAKALGELFTTMETELEDAGEDAGEDEDTGEDAGDGGRRSLARG